MKFILKLSLVYLSTFMGSCASDKYRSERNMNIDDQSRAIYLLDGNPESPKKIEEGCADGCVLFKGGAFNSRDALIKYGEKYRYQVYLFETKKVEK